jgi:hypothetical protein
MQMPSPKWISIATVAVAFATVVPAASAATGDDFFVTPGKTVNGISLGETRAAVHHSTPLGMTTPTSSSVSQAPALGTILTETYIGGAFGNQLSVVYQVPPSKKKHTKGKKKHKRSQPTVVYLATGAGAWFIHDNGLSYNGSPGNSTGSTNVEIGGVYPCSFYQKTPSGQRLYDPDVGDGQFCELIYGQRDYFYFTFNNGALDSRVPAQLAGFTLSAFQIP